MTKVMKKIMVAFSRKEPTSDMKLSLRVVYNRFRQMLNSNNHALEIMSDMGNKLGGNYIFDINYIKKSYSEFSDTVFQSIYNLNALSQNKYLYLHRVFERINTQVNRILQDKAPVDLRETVLFYRNITWEMSDAVGGKNAALAELGNYLNLNIPDGFAITTGAFREFMEYNHLEEKIESLKAEYTSVSNGLDDAFFEKAQQLVKSGRLPAHMEAELDTALTRLSGGSGKVTFVAIRSSADMEDSELSFAGAFNTVLNVPAEIASLAEAYKTVIASLYSKEVLAYQKHHAPQSDMMAAMSVGCMKMVEPHVSGVVYSSDPDNIEKDIVIISANRGLCTTVTDGIVDADVYIVEKNEPYKILERKIGKKNVMAVCDKGGGIKNVPVSGVDSQRPCLSEDRIKAIVRHAVIIENYFKKPQDIEWSVSSSGELVFLQSRPLKISESQLKRHEDIYTTLKKYNIIFENQGIISCRGIGAGKVFVLRRMEDLRDFKSGSVLVAKHDSSQFIKIMPKAAAIITDVGTPTSHMANIAREFHVPTIVNTGTATSVLQNGQEITVDAEDNKVYDGTIKELIRYNITEDINFAEEREFKILKKILRYMTPLNLTDPLSGGFTSEGCQTCHDILRFIHEKGVEELTNAGRYKEILHDNGAVKLDIPIPMEICIVDIGGGLNGVNGKAQPEHITSIPFRAIAEGMMCPSVWHSSADSIAVPVAARRYGRGALCRSGDNVAVVSQEYVNLTLKFGHNFTMIDSYCSENIKESHVYFRFVGGTQKKSQLGDLIATVLRELDMRVDIKGSVIIARTDNISRPEMELLLNSLGRLTAYIQQFDTLVCDDQLVRHYSTSFLHGRYHLSQA
ncbi:MAG: hypothetical protein HQK88_01205 [Nitrospirae bacterium]|nr:hypothetical protein [Nitrospirota bacterium]MBF0533878.1 hypothetical protein [Nitrospirota bacterium]MBF0615413.1 hypothetical protein [Nitrospirota bacterium]